MNSRKKLSITNRNESYINTATGMHPIRRNSMNLCTICTKAAFTLAMICIPEKVFSFSYQISSSNLSIQYNAFRRQTSKCQVNKNSETSLLFSLMEDIFSSTLVNDSIQGSNQHSSGTTDIFSTPGILPKSRTTLFMSRNEKSSYDAANGWSRPATLEALETNPNNTSDGNRNGKGKRDSRFGVRSRVRSVLEKAKKRTGIRNNSERIDQPSPQSVIAEAASIGGLGAVIVDEKGTIDVALDYVAPAKNTTEGENYAVNKKSSSPVRNEPKKAPASTYSKPPVQIKPGPEDYLSTSSSTKSTTNQSVSTSAPPISVRDAFTGDVSAAFSVPPSPLPFTLPKLTAEQTRQVNAGERVQFQSDMGREGSGFVVVDVKAPPDAVWDCLLDFESYPQTIPTVRTVNMKSKDVSVLKHGVASETRASFSLSKFRLRVAAVHKYRPHELGDYMVFSLDPTCTNLVLQNAKGVWYTQKDVDGRKGITRVWLLCELKVSNMLPVWIVDYAAKKAMPRATTWLKPQVEAAASLWLRKDFSKEE